MVNCWPTTMALASLMLLAAMSTSRSTPNLSAIEPNVSPTSTMYVVSVGVAEGSSGVAVTSGVEVGGIRVGVTDAVGVWLARKARLGGLSPVNQMTTRKRPTT